MSASEAMTAAQVSPMTAEQPLLQGLIAKPGQRRPERTVSQAPPRRSSLTAIPAEPAPEPVVEPAPVPVASSGPRVSSKPFQLYKIEEMATVLNDPTGVCARAQMELRGMDRSPKQLQLRVSEALQTTLKAYCAETNIQQRALVEALLRAFLAAQGRPVQD